MKLVPLSTPQAHVNPGQQESHAKPFPDPRAQSDAQRSNFVRSENVADGARTVTAEYRVEFSHSEPSRPTGREALDMLTQISRGRMISRVNSRI